MERYRIPFKDPDNNSFEVKIFIDGYTGEVTELTGAVDAFVVTSHDDDFVYTPVRTSTAVISILDNDLLLDLFSVNTQNSPVKAYRNNELIWSGYITPEQFTQPYKGTKDVFSIDCVSAIATLKYIEYVQQSSTSFIDAFSLLRYLISSAKGSYDKIFIPHVYATGEDSYLQRENIFSKITLAEHNFTSEKMKLSEVLNNLMQFFSWTIYDEGGSIYIVDHDWHGEYYCYNESLTSFEVVKPNTVLLQDIGFAGSNHTIDVKNGYNKIKVTSINNVFDDVVVNEDFEKLKKFYESVSTINNPRKKSYRKFCVLKDWKLWAYTNDGIDGVVVERELTDDEVIAMKGSLYNQSYGAIAYNEGLASLEEREGDWVPAEANYSWSDTIRIRTRRYDAMDVEIYGNRVMRLTGATAFYKEGAISINANVTFESISKALDADIEITNRFRIPATFRIGDNYWNGSEWVNEEVKFYMQIGKIGDKVTQSSIANTKELEMPYDGMSGYMVILPDDRILTGQIEFTMYSFSLPGDQDVLPNNVLRAIILKGLKFNYKAKDNIENEGESGDREYENIANDKYLSELIDIEFGVGSYNKDGATYSKVLLNDDFLTDNLYSAIEKTLIRPEEAFIRRVINRYKVTKIKLSQVIKNSINLHPFTTIYDRSMNSKRFLLLGGEKNYSKGYQTISITDNGDRDS